MPTATRKFTRAGFPKPDTREEFKHDEVVWALVNQKYPYWPAQIKLDGGTIHCPKKKASTKGMKCKIPIITFNDPELTVTEMTEDDIINERAGNKPKKRKKDISKRRVIDRSKLLKWETKKRDRTEINYHDVAKEYLKRKGLEAVDDIDASIWREWNDNALPAAEDEIKRMIELERLEKQRTLESRQLMEAHQNEINRAESMKDQYYDGRLTDPETGERHKIGWVLRAGDRIRYWPQCQTIGNQQNIIVTTITCIRDKYGTLKLKDTVPIDVEASGNPPFWNTEIEKLPSKDPLNPVYYPLSQCLFIPSQIEDKLETEHIKIRNEFNQELQKKGWGHMLYKVDLDDADDDENDDNSNNQNKNKKNRGNTSNADGDYQFAPIVIDSDLEILEVQKSKNRSNKKRKRMADSGSQNSHDDVVMADKTINLQNSKKAKRVRKRKKSPVVDTAHDITHYLNNGNNQSNANRQQCVQEPPKKKKRRLNNGQISINQIMDENVIQREWSTSPDITMLNGNQCNNNNTNHRTQAESDSEEELILDLIDDNNNAVETGQDSDCQIIQQFPSRCNATKQSSSNVAMSSSASKRRKASRKRKNHSNANNSNNVDTSTESDSSMKTPIPWPQANKPSSPKRRNRKNRNQQRKNKKTTDSDDTDTDGVKCKPYSSLNELPCNKQSLPQTLKPPPPQQRKSKRNVRVNRDNNNNKNNINANAPKQKQSSVLMCVSLSCGDMVGVFDWPVVLMNYVDDACCPPMLHGGIVHDEFCPHLVGNDNQLNAKFVSGNGNICDRNNLPHSLGVHCMVSTSHTSSSSPSTFASSHSPVSPGSLPEFDGNHTRHRHQKQPPKPPPPPISPPYLYDTDHCHNTHEGTNKNIYFCSFCIFVYVFGCVFLVNLYNIYTAPKKKKKTEKLSNSNNNNGKKTMSDLATKSKSMTASLRGRTNTNRQSELLDKLIDTAGRQQRMRVQDPPPRKNTHSKQRKNKNKNKSKNIQQRFQYRDFKNETETQKKTNCNTENNGKRGKHDKACNSTPKSNKKRQSSLQDNNQALSPSMELKLNDLLSFGEQMRK